MAGRPNKDGVGEVPELLAGGIGGLEFVVDDRLLVWEFEEQFGTKVTLDLSKLFGLLPVNWNTLSFVIIGDPAGDSSLSACLVLELRGLPVTLLVSLGLLAGILGNDEDCSEHLCELLHLTWKNLLQFLQSDGLDVLPN